MRLNGRSGAEGLWTQIATCPPGSASYSDTSALSGSTVSYRVRAVSFSGAAFSGATIPMELETPLATPTGLRLGGSTSGIALDWADASVAIGYNVYRGTTSNFEANGDSRITTNLRDSQLMDNDVPSPGLYYYKIKGIWDGHEGPAAIASANSSIVPAV